MLGALWVAGQHEIAIVQQTALADKIMGAQNFKFISAVLSAPNFAFLDQSFLVRKFSWQLKI